MMVGQVRVMLLVMVGAALPMFGAIVSQVVAAGPVQNWAIVVAIGVLFTSLTCVVQRRQDASWLPAAAPDLAVLLEVGRATRGMSVTVGAGHLIVGRTDEHGADPRFRLTPLGAGAYGLSRYRRQRWELLPYEGTLQELAVTMNNDLSAWADDWS